MGGIGGAGGEGGEGGTACTSHLEFEAIVSFMRADSGWNGVAHRAKFPSGTRFSVETYDCDDDCRRCKIRGPVRNDPVRWPVPMERCLDDLTQVCTSDNDCPVGKTGGKCRIIYAPMINGGSSPTCITFYFEPLNSDPTPSAIQGVFDLLTGETDFQIFNLGLALTYQGHCDECIDDVTPNDGVANGHCATDANVSCDVVAESIDVNVPYETSFDCRNRENSSLLEWDVDVETPTNNIGTSSTIWTMDSTRPMCTHPSFSNERCYCGECSDTGLPCSRASDCPMGTCGHGIGVPTKPRGCTNGNACDWDPTLNLGTCPVNTALGCFTNTESISVEGDNYKAGDSYISRVAGIQCNAATGDPTTDGTIGLPGMVYVYTPYRVTPKEL